MLDKITIDSFKDLVGTEAEIIVMNGPNITVKVEKVEAGKNKSEDLPDTCRSEPFSIQMSGPGLHQAPDGIYSVKFEKLGFPDGLYIDNKSDGPDGPPPEASDDAGAGKGKDKGKGKKADAKAQLTLPDDCVVYQITFT